MGNLYTPPPAVFEATGGHNNLVVLPVPYRGTIKTIRLVQTSGVAVAFSFRVFNSKDAAYALTGDSVSASLEGLTPDVYEVIPATAVSSGATYRKDDANYGYENQDGQPGNRKFELYLVIAPSGSGVKEFSMSLGIEQKSPV